MKTLWSRLLSPTPAFWQKVRRLGLVATAIGGTLATAPVALPVWVVVAAGYLTVAGGVTVSLASLTCSDSPTDQPAS